ncbi:MAG: hypothetical protein WAU58_05770 [Terriglobales bacterium]
MIRKNREEVLRGLLENPHFGEFRSKFTTSLGCSFRRQRQQAHAGE